MTNQTGLQRRTLLKAGSLAALGGGVPTLSMAAARETRNPQSIAAWVRTTRNGPVVVAVAEAHGANNWRTVGDFEVVLSKTGATPHLSSFDLRERSADATRTILRRAAAQAWGVSPVDCELSGGRVLSKAAGKDMPYCVWVQV